MKLYAKSHLFVPVGVYMLICVIEVVHVKYLKLCDRVFESRILFIILFSRTVFGKETCYFIK